MVIRRRWPLLAVVGLLGAALGLLLLSAMPWHVAAQGGPTPTPDVAEWYQNTGADVEWDLPYFPPDTQSGEADWRLEDAAFVSLYPRGFEFSAVAESSGGQIESASVIWSHTPNQLKRREAEVDPATGRLFYRWYPDSSLPPWVAVNYYWSLTDSDGNRYRSQWIVGNEYYTTLDRWTRLASDKVVVVVQEGLPRQAADMVLEAVDDQHDMFVEAWGQALPYRPRVILFADQGDFQRWRLGFGGQGIVGQTSEEWGATVQVIVEENLIDLTHGTVLHEIAHLYQIEMVGSFEVGTWWNEGNAVLFELHQHYDYERRVRRLAQRGGLPVLFQGPGPHPIAQGVDGQGRLGYDVGYTFWRWLTTTYGLDMHRAIIERMAAGETRDEALTNATGLSLTEIETRWRRWLGVDSAAPTLVPTPTRPAFPPTPTPFQFPTAVEGS